jgi:uncharacterized protein YicC (UPF0701 family)
VKSQEN